MRRLPRSTLARATLPPLARLQRAFEARRARDAFQHFIDRLDGAPIVLTLPPHRVQDCWPDDCPEHRGAA